MPLPAVGPNPGNPPALAPGVQAPTQKGAPQIPPGLLSGPAANAIANGGQATALTLNPPTTPFGKGRAIVQTGTLPNIFGKVVDPEVKLKMRETHISPTKGMGKFERAGLRKKQMRLFGLAAEYEKAKLPETKDRIEKEMREVMADLPADQRNALLTMRAPNGETFLETLSRDPKNLDIVGKMLDYADASTGNLAIDEGNRRGETILYKAAANGDTALVTKLLMLGANPHINTAAKTPAEVAKGEDLSKLLGDFKMQTTPRDTALEIARLRGEALTSRVEAYLSLSRAAEADPTLAPDRNEAMAKLKQEIEEYKREFPDDREFAQVFFGQLSESGVPPLALSLLDGRHDDLARYLLQSGAPPSFLNDLIDYGSQSLDPNEGMEVFQRVLAFAAENEVLHEALSHRDADGNTPLHNVFKMPQGQLRFDKIGILLQAGANINASNNDGNTPLHLCEASGDEYLVGALIQQGAKNVNNRYGVNPQAVSERRQNGALFYRGMMERFGATDPRLSDSLSAVMEEYLNGRLSEEDLQAISDSDDPLREVHKIHEELVKEKANKRLNNLIADLKKIDPGITEESLQNLRRAYKNNKISLDEIKEAISTRNMASVSNAIKGQQKASVYSISEKILDDLGDDSETVAKVDILMRAYVDGKVSEKEINEAIENETIEALIEKEVKATEGERKSKAKDFVTQIKPKLHDGNLTSKEKEALKELMKNYINGDVLEQAIVDAIKESDTDLLMELLELT